jgi:S1-C subfamily serine protease
MDKYDQVKFKKTVVGKSGEFCSFPDENINSKEGQEMSVIQRVVQDAITNSFYEVLDNREAKEWLKVVPDSLGKSALPLLTINRGTSVKDIKSAMEATTVIMTNKGHGSGCVVGADGYIVTSFHVVANVDSNIKVLFNNGDTVLAKVERISEISDLALLKVKRTCKASYVITETPAYEIADEVFAVGTPAAIDLGQTVSKGIISGVRKESNGVELIQTDVSVNPGNSGGALNATEHS